MNKIETYHPFLSFFNVAFILSYVRISEAL